MITLNASGGSITFEFSGNSTYLNDGTITVPVNSLALIIDESDMATFRKAASNDIFVSANIAEFGMTKAELESWYKANMVGSTGGGGITSGEVQSMIDEAVSGKQDTLISGANIKTINNESILGSGNITIQGGGGGTVDETPIYTIWENDFRDASQSINARKAILDFQGDKSITTGTYVYAQILNKTSGQWYYPNATLNYVEGTYTKSQDDNNYLVVEYNSEIEDFIVSVSDNYPNAILFSVTFYSGKIKIESATIESGDTSDVIETSVANIFGDLYTKDLANVNMVSLDVMSPKNLRLVSQKKNGTSNGQNIKLDDLIATVNGADKTIKTDIKVPLGTSGWTEVSNISASTCNTEYLGEPLPFTSFRLTYNTNDMNMLNLRLRAGTTSYSTAFFINWDSSQNKFVVSNETFSATTITLDTTNHILTVELPATIEYGGTQGQTILFGLNSDRCQFGYSITKLEYYGEEKQDLIPFIQQLRSDVDSILNRLQNNP